MIVLLTWICNLSCDLNRFLNRVLSHSSITESPTSDEQARGECRCSFAESTEGRTAHFLVRLRGARDENAREVSGQSFVKPLGGEQGEVTAGHVNDAGRVFDLGERRLVVRLGMVASRENDVGCAVSVGE